MELRSDGPCKLPFKLLESITDNFSKERKIGSGSYGEVYKGVFDDGEEIAVKRLRCSSMPDVDDEQFQNEFASLKKFKHENIVQLLGFSDETEDTVAVHKGKLVSCQKIHRAICLEYMPNGSLTKLLTDKCDINNWPIRYKVIKGICEGLKYLHEGLEDPILHLDIKPGNILLNKQMVPKIADFGISRLVGERNTRNTSSSLGTRGYLPPEFINYGIISKEYDIFSVGVVIMKIIIGSEGYLSVTDEIHNPKFIDNAYNNWRSLQDMQDYAFVEPECKQVRSCLEIALICMDKDRHRRPKINDITSRFDEIDFFSSLQQQPRTTTDISNIQWIHMRHETKVGAQQPHYCQHQCMVFMQHHYQKNQLQQSQQNIILHCQSLEIQLQRLFWMVQQPSLQQQFLAFANRIAQENTMNLQTIYILAHGGLQHSFRYSSNLKNSAYGRTLTIPGTIGQAVSFIYSKLLRVLVLECTNLEYNHLGIICDLPLLTYLSLCGHISQVPRKIEKLKFLQTIDLRKTTKIVSRKCLAQRIHDATKAKTLVRTFFRHTIPPTIECCIRCNRCSEVEASTEDLEGDQELRHVYPQSVCL